MSIQLVYHWEGNIHCKVFRRKTKILQLSERVQYTTFKELRLRSFRIQTTKDVRERLKFWARAGFNCILPSRSSVLTPIYSYKIWNLIVYPIIGSRAKLVVQNPMYRLTTRVKLFNFPESVSEQFMKSQHFQTKC